MSSPSLSDDALRQYLMTDDEIFDAEDSFPGVIHINLVTRDRARIVACNEVWDFKLERSYAEDVEDGEKALRCVTPRNIRRKDVQDLRHWDLIWHRAAEAMLAVRRAQFEAREATRKRKLAQAAKKLGCAA